MRDEARRIWKSLRMNGHIPERWGDADSVIRSYYAGEMRRFFPELQLCELDFKAHRIAINIYPAWHARFATVEETPAPAPKRSASEAPESEPAKKKPRGRKTAKQSGSTDDLLPPADPTSAPSASAVPISSLAPSASSSAPPPVLAPVLVSITPSPSVISAPQPSHSSLPPPAPPLVSPPSQSSMVPSPVDLSAATVAVNKNMELDSDLPIAPASGPSMSTSAGMAAGPSESTSAPATAAGPSMSAPATTAVGAGPAVTAVDNPLAFLGDSTGPTTRADFIADVTKPKQERREVGPGKIYPPEQDQVGEASAYRLADSEDRADALLDRNLCLIDYIEKKEIPLPGKVQSDVFDRYYSGLTKEELKVWADKSKDEKKDKPKDTLPRTFARLGNNFYSEQIHTSIPCILQLVESPWRSLQNIQRAFKPDETITHGRFGIAHGRHAQVGDAVRRSRWEMQDSSAADGRVVAAAAARGWVGA
ncbi:hypothetical protein K438DRAFT_1777937 [Mycena galopus ATCC 62051]|nr:hypothetical protein K438DRAFT_1777937 [Mycena galopus ATCC 62051]